MKFADMPYTRPNIDEIKAKFAVILEKFTAAKSFADADAAYTEYYTAMSDVETLASIVYVRHTINTEDEFYDKENDFVDEAGPQLRELDEQMNKALCATQFRPEFEKKYGKILFTNIELELKSFSPEIVPDFQEEAKLVSEYCKLLASAQIPFDGGTYTLSQLTPLKAVVDDEKRRAAWLADASFGTENADKLDEYYDKLVKVRDRMAKKLGYKNYIEMGYCRMHRNCYTADDVEKFRHAVIKHLVPVADKIIRQQAERIGRPYPMSLSDASLSFRSGNPKPQGDADAVLAQGAKLYHELSAETSEFIDFMYENELLDVLSRKGKAGGGYCITLPTYKSPFIFANFNGTQGDVEVVTHEAGHAFAAYRAFKNNIPVVVHSPSLESCEIHSMSMEFFAWGWAKGFFGEDTDKFLYSHLAGALTFIPYGTMVDHFQHIMYEKPEMTPAERNQTWAELTHVYMPWIKLENDLPFYSEGRRWQRQSHIYEVPFYYIDYCLAQTAALEFWVLMQHDRADAWKRYTKLVDLAGTRTFDELVESAGIDTPFGDDALKKVSDEAIAWLNTRDLSKLH